MMCYKDRTFCPFFDTCRYGNECDRALTENVKYDAEKWMKNAPICQFVEKPECWREVEKCIPS